MSRIISVKCPNIRDCGHVNVFPESDLIGDVPLKVQGTEKSIRLPPPPVVVDDNTFVKCEKCGYPINCADATISD